MRPTVHPHRSEEERTMRVMRWNWSGEGNLEPFGTKSASPRSTHRYLRTRLGGEANPAHGISQPDMERQ